MSCDALMPYAWQLARPASSAGCRRGGVQRNFLAPSTEASRLPHLVT